MKTLGNDTDRRKILERMASLTRDDRARWGKMSAHQMLCHLRDSYCLALGEKAASSATGILQRTIVKGFALWVPIHWPKGVPTRPEMEQGKGGTPPVEFQSDRNALGTILDRFCNEVRTPRAAHPIFGPMTPEEWRRWGYLHADHHLRQFGR
jgi:hypothetical protein